MGTWTPLDFIVNGEFADANYIRDIVDRIRHVTGSACAILLAHQGEEIFQCLMYVSHSEPSFEGLLQRDLSQCEVRYVDRQDIKHLLERAPQLELLEYLPERFLRQNLFSTLCRQFQGARGTVFVPDWHPRRTVSLPRLTPLIGVFCVEPSQSPPPELMNELVTAVNASAPVYIRRLDEYLRSGRSSIDGAAHESERNVLKPANKRDLHLGSDDPASSTNGSHYFHAFLLRILEHTRSSQGSIYLRQDTTEELVPLARIGPVGTGYAAYRGEAINLRPERWIDGIPMVDGVRGVVAHTYLGEKPILFNDCHDFQQMNNKIGVRPFTSGESIKSDLGLAVPIVDEQGTKLGVLVIEKWKDWAGWSSQGVRPFSIVDYLFLKSAADQLGSRWTRGWNDSLYRIVKEAERKYRFRPSARSNRGEPPTQDSTSAIELPSDFAASRRDMAELLSPLCSVVPAISSCQVRVLSVDQSCLGLLISHPTRSEGVVLDPIHLISQASESKIAPEARVIRDGRERCGPSSHLTVREPGLKSYIAMPLFLKSRCVGTVTFTSKYSPIFLAFYRDALQEAADIIVKALEFTQARTVASVLSETTQVFLHTHDLSKIPDRVMGHLRTIKSLIREAPDRDCPVDVPVRISCVADEISTDMAEINELLGKSVLGETTQVFPHTHELSKIPERINGHLETIKRLIYEAPDRDCSADASTRIACIVDEIGADMVEISELLSKYDSACWPEITQVPANQTYSVRKLVDEIFRPEAHNRMFQVEVDFCEPGWDLRLPTKDQLIGEEAYKAFIRSVSDLVRKQGFWPLSIAQDHISQFSYSLCLEALRDLIRNALTSMDNGGFEFGLIFIHRRILGGRLYGCITICNPLGTPLERELRRFLYREPVHKRVDNRIHHGAFLAGWLIRAMGGDVFLAGPSESSFNVTVEIPLETSETVGTERSAERPETGWEALGT
jgi:DNA-binding FrmR family transcriptional regulator